MIKRAFMSAVKASVLELLVYDEIGENFWTEGGITASTLAAAIKAAGQYDSIVLRINSPGGNAFDGVAIYNLLRAQKKPIDVFVDGIAASAASVVAMAGDSISMGTGAMLMVHNAMWGCYGDAQALRSAADTIETISVTIGEIYVKRTKQDAAKVKAMMDAETWMGGEQAVELGFATKTIEQDDTSVAAARALAQSFNLKAFKHAPKFEAEKTTKRVDGEDLEKSDFAYQGSEKTADWKLPIKFSTDEKTKSHIRNAISRWSSTDMPDADEKKLARGRILAAAKDHGIDVDEDSLELKGARNESVDPDCECECTPCRTVGCSGCENDPCEAIGCDCPNHTEMSAAYIPELDIYRRRLALRERAA